MISEKEIISIVNAKLEETSNFVVDVNVITFGFQFKPIVSLGFLCTG